MGDDIGIFNRVREGTLQVKYINHYYPSYFYILHNITCTTSITDATMAILRLLPLLYNCTVD